MFIQFCFQIAHVIALRAFLKPWIIHERPYYNFIINYFRDTDRLENRMSNSDTAHITPNKISRYYFSFDNIAIVLLFNTLPTETIVNRPILIAHTRVSEPNVVFYIQARTIVIVVNARSLFWLWTVTIVGRGCGPPLSNARMCGDSGRAPTPLLTDLFIWTRDRWWMSSGTAPNSVSIHFCFYCEVRWT